MIVYISCSYFKSMYTVVAAAWLTLYSPFAFIAICLNLRERPSQ